jgi:hypothetical protein
VSAPPPTTFRLAAYLNPNVQDATQGTITSDGSDSTVVNFAGGSSASGTIFNLDTTTGILTDPSGNIAHIIGTGGRSSTIYFDSAQTIATENGSVCVCSVRSLDNVLRCSCGTNSGFTMQSNQVLRSSDGFFGSVDANVVIVAVAV